MPATQASAEEAVVAAALSRGFVTAAQVEKARRDVEEFARRGQRVELLAVVSARHLAPPQRDELRKVYQDALVQSRPPSAPAPEPGNEESTQLLDRPVLPPGAAPPAGGEAGATLSAGAPHTFGASPGQPLKATNPDLRAPAEPAPSTAGTVGMDRTVAQGPPTGDLATPPRADGKGKGPPKRIGNYDITRELGRGGMGVVYEARHVTLDRRVALKVLLAGPDATGEDVLRFQVEAKAAARLDHPNVVRVHEQGQDAEGHWFMAMDLVEGESLVARLEREGALDPREAASVVRDVARAVAYAHGQSVLHRDLKPHNVLLDRSGTPKLTDFGLAKLVGDQRGKSITRTGSGILGSPAYMSPEQAGDDAKRVDVRCDVYGLGATLYHAITGKMPFDGDTLARVVVAVLQKPPVPPSKVNRKVPKDLETICLKCLEKEPKHRYQSAGDLVSDLDRFLEDQAIAARPPSSIVRGGRWAARNPRAVAAGATLLLLLVAGVVYEAHSRAAASADEAAKTAAAKRQADEKEKEAADASAREAAARKKAEDAEIRQRVAEETAKREREERERQDAERKTKEDAALKREADRKAEERRKADELRKIEDARKAEELRRADEERARAAANPPSSNTASPPPTPQTEPAGPTEPPPPGPDLAETTSPTPVPGWLERLRRPTSLPAGSARLAVTCDVEQAFQEAHDRRCPVVLLLLRWDVRTVPPPLQSKELVAWLNTSAVVVLLQNANTTGSTVVHQKVGPCPMWPELPSCELHDTAWEYTKDKRRAFWPLRKGETLQQKEKDNKRERPKLLEDDDGNDAWVLNVRGWEREAHGLLNDSGRGPIGGEPPVWSTEQLASGLAELGARAIPARDVLQAAEAITRAGEAIAEVPTSVRKAFIDAVGLLRARAEETDRPWSRWARYALDGLVTRLSDQARKKKWDRADLVRITKDEELAERALAR